MAVTGTVLSAAVTKDALDIAVASPAGAAKDKLCKIDNELSVVTKVLGNMVSLRSRGDQGTACVPHGILAPVSFFDSTDAPESPHARHRMQETEIDGLVTYGVSGPIAIPAKNTTIDLAGAVALTMTLADPPRTIDGRRLTIRSTGAAAHVITSAGGFNAGAGAADIATFAAAIGNGLVIEAKQGKWLVISNVGVTIA